jgi:hypothetical protein
LFVLQPSVHFFVSVSTTATTNLPIFSSFITRDQPTYEYGDYYMGVVEEGISKEDKE